ncbi:hypothetical protein C7H85_04545 [Zobellella endophytica]|uniref:Uncharacterized protein n=1 Tax=Zobellella endophytica TaxID=2116700 RepID=A0A2P7RCW7_9GAMM|nr:hypothetical protein [Zobellella endophytica]PSJ48061.1 hypothetical protein C7H85_04545 [Zobellella endophytica]
MTVRQRQVFYLSGFDPRGAGHYHRLYKTQAAGQKAVNGLDIKVSRRQRLGADAHQWWLEAGHTRSRYTFLSWDDIIRAHWAKSWWAILGDLFYCLWAYFANGLIFTFARASYKQMLAGLYPFLYITATLVLAWLAGSGLCRLVQTLPVPPSLATGLGLTAGTLAGLLILAAAKRLGNRSAVFWLLRIYAFSAKWGKGRLPELEPRMAAFGERIRAALADERNDEVLVVAHSVGTMLVLPIIARVLAQTDRRLLANRRLVLITLGQCIPLISFQPGARDYRRDLQQLGQDPDLLWLDYTAPTDGACFPLLDPLSASGLEAAPDCGPYILSPRFFTLYHADRYRKLRRAWYTMHFLYLMATDKPGPYDYFAFTAGSSPMASRLETPS